MPDIQHIRLDAQPDSFVALARQFATLDSERRELEDRVKTIKEECQALEAQLVLAFENHDIAGPIKLRDLGLAVYVHRSRYASADSEHLPELRAALEANGLGHFVKPAISAQTLSAWAREVEEAGGEIPEEIGRYVKLATIYRIRTRKAAK
jgi:hypothetical protein